MTVDAGFGHAYPGGAGIDKDPRVVFVEDFEEPSLDDMAKRWESVQGKEILSFTDDAPPGSGGKRSLRMTHVGGQGHGAHLYRRLRPGYEKLYARWYVKFDPDCGPIHHFGTNIGGYNPPTPWPQGGAGALQRGRHG